MRADRSGLSRILRLRVRVLPPLLNQWCSSMAELSNFPRSPHSPASSIGDWFLVIGSWFSKLKTKYYKLVFLIYMGRKVWVIGFSVRIGVPLLNQRYSSMAEQSHMPYVENIPGYP